jgi:hypothetical protein
MGQRGGLGFFGVNMIKKNLFSESSLLVSRYFYSIV